MTGLVVPQVTSQSPSQSLQYTDMNNSNQPCLAVYSPNGVAYVHGDKWGAGRCPSWGSQPGGPMYEWLCENGEIIFTQPCQLGNAQLGDSCINGAPHGTGYNIGECSLTNGHV